MLIALAGCGTPAVVPASIPARACRVGRPGGGDSDGDPAGVVIVQDMFGVPVAGAEVRLLHQDGEGDDVPAIITDQDGRATYSGDAYAAYASATDLFGSSYDEVPSGDLVDFHARPSRRHADRRPGQRRCNGGSADGRTLSVGARLYVVEG